MSYYSNGIQTIECRFALKIVHDMIVTYSQVLQFSAKNYDGIFSESKDILTSENTRSFRMETFELWKNDPDVSVANIESFTTWFKYINLTALIQEEKR